MRFSVCNELFEGWGFGRVCATAAELGYGGVEIAPFTLGKLAGEVSPGRRAEMRRAAAAAGVEIVGLHWLLARTEGFHINHPDAPVRERTAAYLDDLIGLCADLGGKIMVFGSPMQRNVCESLTYDEAWELAAGTFEAVVPALAKRGVTLCLEPLAPEETGFINTAEEASRMIRRIGSPNFRLLLDVKAMSAERTPIPDIISAHGGQLAHFHANDANKRGPGFGDTDFGPIAAALASIDYRGWVSVEVFDFSPDPLTIARESLAYLKRVFQ